MPDQPLDGAVALVTGAGGGIGAATARRLAREGAVVALLGSPGDRSPGGSPGVPSPGHGLARVADDIAGFGGHAVAVEADATGPAGAEDAVQQVLDRFGRLDVLVNGPGVRLLNSALHTTVEDWDRMVALNVEALLHVTHAAVPHLIYAASTSPRQVADLVNVGSAAGRAPRPGSSVYALGASGLSAFTESLRQELIREQVRVGVVEPGFAEAGLADDVADAIGYIVTRDRRVAVNQMLVRAADQVW
ncbi:NADP-dependent 3-hydroxy acid dehydrogenase YdfG [Actinomadura meyerae]|uniref:NADP-dependent 3-hydroxy acid dehydrogenase YdfG n=1 Tax=Actinomadura meyerae TaxID=240840 RepID=A0A239KPU6_9ACTN|nr:SDR family NAD(P)-dependent oxidoreductase [Actinomadura meyerae]SNT20181.1 NADP-dependent 3-hydroxy acid dehydrogenase YdfG [Actinomadura meyerae]